ncbi:MAG: TonB-dependent receptor, partial [Myxococcota bacterium]
EDPVVQTVCGFNSVLTNQTLLNELRTDNDVTLSGLLTLSAIWDNHELSTNTFVVNQTQQRTQFSSGLERGEEIRDVQRSLLSWIERSLVAQQLIGSHDLQWMKVEYRALLARAARDAPDRRSYQFGKNQEQEQFLVQRGRGLERSYSFVKDDQLAYGLDLTFPLFEYWQGDNEESFLRPKLKVGFARQEVEREAGEQRFLWNISATGDPFIDSPEVVFDPALTGTGLEFRDASILGADDYNGQATITGAFVQADVEIGDVLRLVGGVRWERADFLVESFQLAAQNSEIEPSGFEVENYLPAALLTWFALDDLQIRAAFGRSVSRPVLNELAPSFFFDPDSGQQYSGNPDLVQTVIDGFDARVEWYPSTTESVTLGVFRKEYDNPLEQTFQAIGGGGIVATFQNADNATVTGYELGGRTELSRLRKWIGGPALLDDIYLSANVAILDSLVQLESVGVATSAERTLQGQADIVINAQAGYDGETFDLTVAYNRVGERLQIVGVFENPDIVQDPLDTLDVNISWEAFENAKVTLQGSNLLNPSIRLAQQVQGQDELVFREFKRGRGVSLGLSYQFD